MNFIKTLIFPTKMNRYRYMSSLIAILIFFVGSFILTIPGTVRINKEKFNLLSDFGLSFLSEIPNDEEGQKLLNLKEYGCKVENDELVCSVEDIPQAQPVIVSYKTIVSPKKGEEVEVTRNVYFVFDFYDYKNQTTPQYNIQEDFDNLAREDNVNNYLVVFYKYGILAKIQPMLDKNGKPLQTRSDVILYSSMGFNMSEFKETPNEAGTYIAERIMVGTIPIFKNELMITSIMLVLLMLLLIITVVWLISRKNGRLKTFKEYYNIASICSIAIFLIFFVAYWFIPIALHINFFIYFNSLFALYYLFAVFKINNLPEII